LAANLASASSLARESWSMNLFGNLSGSTVAAALGALGAESRLDQAARAG